MIFISHVIKPIIIIIIIFILLKAYVNIRAWKVPNYLGKVLFNYSQYTIFKTSLEN